MGFSEDQERHRGQVETVREWAQTAWSQTGEPGSQPAECHRDAAIYLSILSYLPIYLPTYLSINLI